MPGREIELNGRRWRIYKIDYPQQVEVECILARLLGPAAGHTLGALASGIAPTIVDVLRETTGDGESFDLSRILELDTADPRIRGAWDLLLDGLGRILALLADLRRRQPAAARAHAARPSPRGARGRRVPDRRLSRGARPVARPRPASQVAPLRREPRHHLRPRTRARRRRGGGCVSEWRQPWHRVDVDGERCRLQVLDPATAFEVEPVLAAALGDAASLAIVAPRELAAAALRAGGLDQRRTLAELAADPVAGGERAARVVQAAGAIVSRALTGLDLSPALLCELHERCVLGRLRVRGEDIEDARDWSELDWHPFARWQLLAAQVRQTFGPLWTRSPYKLRVPEVRDGVPEPVAVPVAIRYAATIAERGYASSTHEVLTRWTPVRMIEVVEAAAYDAARRNAAYEQAQQGAR